MGVEDPAQRNVFYHKQKKKRQSNIFNTNVKIFFLLNILSFMRIHVLKKAKIKKLQKVIVFKFKLFFNSAFVLLRFRSNFFENNKLRQLTVVIH